MNTDISDLVRRLRMDRENWVDAKAADLIEAQAKQIEALTTCLKTANANHEEFERKWYLALDEIEALQADSNRLDFLGSLSTYRGSWMGCIHRLDFVCELDSPDGNFRHAVDAAIAKATGKTS